MAPDIDAAPAIVSPTEGSTYVMTPTIPPPYQSIALRAAVPTSEHLSWTMDGVLLGPVEPMQPHLWTPVVGTHVVSLVGDDGVAAEVSFTVEPSW